MNLVFLPATAPGDTSYGSMPRRLDCAPAATIRHVEYPRLVWYNAAVRESAIAQIRAWGVSPVVLVGFSKSGLGAWNMTRAIPDEVAATLLFDAPVARESCPPWGTAPFYADDAAWQEDLPIRAVEPFAASMPAQHRLVLVAGPQFGDDMGMLSHALDRIGHAHTLVDGTAYRHHWNSGWIDSALSALVDGRHAEHGPCAPPSQDLLT